MTLTFRKKFTHLRRLKPEKWNSAKLKHFEKNEPEAFPQN